MKAALPCFKTVRISFQHCTKSIVVLIASLYTLKTPLCTLTLLQDKQMIMQLPSHVTTFHINIIEHDPYSDDQDYFILGPEPIKRKPLFMVTPSQIKTTIHPSTFTAQGGIYSNADIDHFWKKTLNSKHSDSAIHLLGKVLSYSFISSGTFENVAIFPHYNLYIMLRNGLHDKLVSLISPLTPT